MSTIDIHEIQLMTLRALHQLIMHYVWAVLAVMYTRLGHSKVCLEIRLELPEYALV